jgi:hypothetical protein
MPASPTGQPADHGNGLGKALGQPAADRRIDILRTASAAVIRSPPRHAARA